MSSSSRDLSPSASSALERERRLRIDAHLFIWRVLERFDQIPTPEEADRAADKIVAAFSFLYPTSSAKQSAGDKSRDEQKDPTNRAGADE